ncbi:MAG TPA: AI-2E family transporter [Solirubrobacteraceae bacterium]|nr:AI-2E family transporter [Solirubrobacteraceae bacterium]
MTAGMPPEHVVAIRARTVLMVAAVLLGVLALVWVVLRSQQVLVWMLVSLLLAMALNPAVDTFERLGGHRRGAAAALVFLLVLGLITGIGALVIPTLAQQISDFAKALPDYVRDLTSGQGPLGFLETKYHVVDRVEAAVAGDGDAASIAGGASAALDVTRGIATFVIAVLTITFLTIFMVLEGPRWITAGIEMLPAARQAEAREIADEIYQLVGRYVTGNLLISLIAGVTTTIVLLVLDVPFALALGLLVAVLDLIPLAGATLGALIVTLVALTDSVTTAVIVASFFIIYQQLENHLLQPVVYGRTVRLSPLAILVSVLIGVEVAGIVGALIAIPVGGTINILLEHWRRRRPTDAAEPDEEPDEQPTEDPAEQHEPQAQPRRRGRFAPGSLP